MKKREFLKTGALAATGLLLGGPGALAAHAASPQQQDPAAFRAAQERRTRLKAPVTAKGKIGNLEVLVLVSAAPPHRFKGIARLAGECGWQTDAYLKRLFKRTTGLTMREWRNRCACRM